MTLEERKNNLYFDKSGKQILAGDLLKVFHFKSRNRIYYMYHVAVIEGVEGSEKNFPVMAFKAHYSDKPHCRAYVVCDSQRVCYGAKNYTTLDFETKRQKIKVNI